MSALSTPPKPALAQFDDLMLRHQAGVWRYLRALGADPAAADELTQDVFVLAHQKFAAVPRDGGAGPFLRKLAHDRFVDVQRAAARWDRQLADYAQQLASTWTDADDAADGGPWLQALRSCVARLDGRSQTLVVAFYGEGRSREQVAAESGLGVEGVKSALARLRRALRACVEAKLATEDA